MKYERELVTVKKLSRWAENLPDHIDFVDYWYNLFKSNTLFAIVENPMNKINAFGERRWQEEFEENYTPIYGNGYDVEVRAWFAWYLLHVVYYLQISTKELAEFYGKQMFEDFCKRWYTYHTFGSKLFFEKFVQAYGSPTKINDINALQAYW